MIIHKGMVEMQMMKSSLLVFVLILTIGFMHGSPCYAGTTKKPVTNNATTVSPNASNTDQDVDDGSGVDDNYNDNGSFDDDDPAPAPAPNDNTKPDDNTSSDDDDDITNGP